MAQSVMRDWLGEGGNREGNSTYDRTGMRTNNEWEVGQTFGSNHIAR